MFITKKPKKKDEVSSPRQKKAKKQKVKQKERSPQSSQVEFSDLSKKSPDVESGKKPEDPKKEPKEEPEEDEDFEEVLFVNKISKQLGIMATNELKDPKANKQQMNILRKQALSVAQIRLDSSMCEQGPSPETMNQLIIDTFN